MLYLKKHLPIYRIGKFIDIGNIGTNFFLQLNYCTETLVLLERLVLHGIELESIKENPIFEKLYSKGLLNSYESFSFDEKSIRNLLFMDFLEIDPKNLKKIFNQKILIFGAGAAGGIIAYLLVQFGYKNITIVDDDTVEISDIYKTLIYKKQDIDKHKVLALKKTIKENFDINIRTIISSPKKKENISSVIEHEKPNLIIKACDPDLSFRYYLNEVCFKIGIPFVYMSYSFDRINIGPFFVPGMTKSDEVLENYFTKTMGAEYTFLNHQKLFPNYTVHPSISFNINILANIVLKEIVFFHLKKFEFVFSLNREVFFFPLTMRVFYKDLNVLSD